MLKSVGGGIGWGALNWTGEANSNCKHARMCEQSCTVLPKPTPDTLMSSWPFVQSSQASKPESPPQCLTDVADTSHGAASGGNACSKSSAPSLVLLLWHPQNKSVVARMRSTPVHSTQSYGSLGGNRRRVPCSSPHGGAAGPVRRRLAREFVAFGPFHPFHLHRFSDR